MAILETFYILFKSNSKQLDKDTVRVKNLLGSIGSDLLKLAAVGLSVDAIFRNLKDSIDYGKNLSLSSQQLGVNAQMLDEWQNAVVSAGGSADSFSSSIQSLSQKLLLPTKDVLKLLPSLANLFHQVGTFRAMWYGKNIGLDPATILLLMKGREGVEQLIRRQRELGVLTEQDTKIFNDFRVSLTDTEHASRSLFSKLAEEVLPYLDKILNGFTNLAVYLRHHLGIIKGAMLSLITLLGLLTGAFIAMNPVIFIAVAVFTALSAAIGLVYDDIETFKKGGESLIGDVLNKFPIIGQTISSVFHVAAQAINLATDALKSFSDKIEELAKKNITDKGYTFENLSDKVHQWSLDNLPSWLTYGGKDKFDNMRDALTSAISINSTIPNISDILSGNSSVNIQIPEITINTQATNSKEIAQNVGNNLIQHIRQALNQAATGNGI